MQNDAAATEFTKPSRLSIFWWRNYFADDPSSIFKEKDVYYDRQGTLNYPTDRAPPFAYWGHNSGSWYWLAYWNCGGAGTSNNDCDCGRTDSCDGDGCLLALGIIVAFFAIIMAAMIVFTWPPSMIISWTVLVIGSFVEVINGKNPSCLNFRIYNATSAAAVLLYLIHVTLAVYQLQNNYNGYYPGTPGIKINVDRLLSFFKRSKLIFAWICLPAILLMIGGIIVGSCVNVSVCASFSSCYWTSLTLYAWVVVHFLNAVASYSMYTRMEKKYQKLKNPPSYEYVYEGSNELLYTSQPSPREEVVIEPLPSYK